MNVWRMLILGGTRSGKSRYALQLAEAHGRRPLYVATAEVCDAEMAERIAAHKKTRSRQWVSAEEPLEIARLISQAGRRFPGRDVLLVDCLTVWLSNVLFREGKKSFNRRSQELLKAVRKSKRSLIMVSNEVGLGIVPPTELGRQFRDLAGRLNQDLAEACEAVVFVAAGLPMVLKGGLPAKNAKEKREHAK